MRKDGGKCYVVGHHAVSVLLEHHPEQVKELWLEHRVQLTDSQQQYLRRLGIAVQRMDGKWLEQRTGYARHHGWVAVVISVGALDEQTLWRLVESRGERLTLLVLDEVQDPHNLGACLRSANAFGVDAVVLSRDRACGVSPVVTKAAAGAVASTPLVAVSNLVRCLQQLKQRGVWVYGADDQGDVELDAELFSGPIALVFGSEGKGIRRLVREQCDQLFKIPMFGQVPCLNVSVAVGVGLYVACRRA